MKALENLIRNKHKKYEIAINVNYGGFSLTKEMMQEIGINDAYIFNEDRANPILIKLIKKFKPKDIIVETLELKSICSCYLTNYDGIEKITYRFDENSEPLLNYIKG